MTVSVRDGEQCSMGFQPVPRDHCAWPCEIGFGFNGSSTYLDIDSPERPEREANAGGGCPRRQWEPWATLRRPRGRRGLRLWLRRGGSLPKVSFDAPRFQDIAFAPQFLVRWLSGRKRRFAKALYLKRVPRVRIPPSPPGQMRMFLLHHP